MEQTVSVNYILNTNTNDGVSTDSARLVPTLPYGRGRGVEGLTPPHKIWVKANTLVKTPSNDYHNVWGQGDNLTLLAEQFILETGNTVIILVKSNGDILVRPYITRFNPDYAKQVRRRLGKHSSIYTDGIMITLTLDPKMFSSLHDALTYLQHMFNRLMAALRKRYGKLIYVKAVELQENGNPHIHIVLTGPNAKHISEQWVQKLWYKYGGGTVKVKHVYDPRGAINYLLKYLPKEGQPLNITLAALWANRTKQWTRSFNSNSRRLTQTLLSSNSGYVRVCSLPMSLLPDLLTLLGDGG